MGVARRRDPVQLSRSIVPVLALGVALAVFVSHGSEASAAAMPVDGPSSIALLSGPQLAVVVPTFHNSQHVNVTTITVGTIVHVRVTVAGAFGTPSGYVSGAMYPNGTCSGQPLDTGTPTQLFNGAADVTTLSGAPTVAGKLSVRASFGGNATYSDSTSACMAIAVTKATPSVTLRIHDSGHNVINSLPYGGTVHPDVSVLSRVGAPTGIVRVSWWKNDTCSGPKADESSPYLLDAGHDHMTTYPKPAIPVGK